MSLFEMTVSGGVLILVITVIRALAINRLPKRTFLILWGVALLRLLIPFSLPFQLNIFAMAERASATESVPAVTERNNTVILAAKQAAIAAKQTALAAGDAPSQEVSLWHILWLAGVAAALLFFVIAYIRHLCAFRAAGPVENGFTRDWRSSHRLRRPIAVRESGGITAPLTYGVFRPVILVPAGIDWEDVGTLSYVFAHEYTHIRRFDALLRLLLITALCVHWFNPLVWVMVILALRDMELSCDEAVVRRFGLENRRAYALALLTVEETRRRFHAFASGFGGSAAEERIRAVMGAKKPTAPRRAVSVLLVLCACAVFCTPAAEAEEDPGLQETPGLVTISLEERRQEYRSWWSGSFLFYVAEGDFIKVEITGKGGETVGLFIHLKDSDEATGGWFPLDGQTRELWVKAPESGYYHMATFPYRTDYDEYYAHIETDHAAYHPNGEPTGKRYRGGEHTVDITIRPSAPFVQVHANSGNAVSHSSFELARSD